MSEAPGRFPWVRLVLVAALVAKLDEPSRSVAEIKVFELENADATATRDLLEGSGGRPQCTGGRAEVIDERPDPRRPDPREGVEKHQVPHPFSRTARAGRQGAHQSSSASPPRSSATTC